MDLGPMDGVQMCLSNVQISTLSQPATEALRR